MHIKLDRRRFMTHSLLAASAAVLPVSPIMAEKVDRPNIVFIMADDLGYGEVKALNPQRGKISTPYIDRLIQEGMTFTDAHTGSSVCTPTRYGLLTGRYAWRTRLQRGVTQGHRPCLIDKDTLTIAQMLKEQGYDTGMVGKWHLDYIYADPETGRTLPDKFKLGPPIGSLVNDGPVAHGFDYFYGYHHSGDMKTVVENTKVVAHRPPVTMLPGIENKSIEYIKNHAAGAPKVRPFFLYVPLNSPHGPVVPSPEWQGKSGLNAHADFVMQTDHTVGRIVQAIDDAGLRNDTLIVFTADNGTSAPTSKKRYLEKMGHYPSGSLRGSKSDIWDGGHRVPFIVRWPGGGVTAGSRSDELICHTDFMPTVARIVGFNLGGNAAVDGFSYSDILFGGKRNTGRVPVVHHSINGKFAIRDKQWKLILCPGSGGWTSPNDTQARKKGFPKVQLYNMENDISEQNNLQDKYPERAKQMASVLKDLVEQGRSTPGPRQDNDVKDIDIWKTGK